MRPIKLILSAFGSYAEKQEILFDAKRERLFLITGDTGAGKTTIFDAICFALYGEMSGDIREGRMMRSDFALPDQRTYVEFIFEDKGKLYKIVRNPEYYRQSKRKKKTEDGSFSYRFTKETAKAELFFLNGAIEEGQIAQGINQLEERAFTGTIREVNAKLVEILGLDQRQFTQIAMLAQGEFMKLLVAPTDQKKEIFQRLFHTKKYYQIVKLIGEKKKVKEVCLEKLRTECEIILQETDCAKESKYRMEFHTYKAAYFLHPKKFLQSLETVIKEEEETISIAKQELACLKEQRDTTLLEIHQIEQEQLLFSKLTQAKKKKEQWEKEEKEIKKKEDILEKAERADYVEGKKIIFDEVEKKKEKKMVQIEHKKKEREETKGEREKNKEAFVLIEKEKNENEERLKQEIAELEKNLPKYDEIEEIKKEKKQQEKKQKMLKKSIEELEIEIQRQEIKILKLEQRQLEIEDFIKELPEKKLLLSKVKEELIGYQELKKEVEKIPELLNKKEESQKIFVKAEKEFKEKSHLYEDLVIRFTNGQAGLMAEKLRNGENLPCPVCGNTSYVLLAPLEKEIPTQEQVKRTKKKRDDLEQEMLHTSELAGTEKEAYEKQVLLCKEKYRQLTNGMIEFSMDDGNVLEIDHKILILEKKKKELEVEKRTLEKLEKEREDQRKEIKETKEEIEQKRKKKEDTKGKKEQIDQEFLRLQTAEQIHKKELIYESKQTADLNLREKKEILEKLQITYKELKNKQDLFSEKLLQQETQIQTMSQELERLIVETEEKREQYKQERQEQGFLSEKEWFLAKIKKEQKLKYKQEIEQTKKEVIAARQSVIELEKQLTGKEEKDPTQKKEELEKKKEQIELYTKKEQSMEFRQKKNKEALEKLEQGRAYGQKLEQEYKEIKILYDVANGTLAGAIKVDLETFVQRQYLKQVLKAANRRFLAMSKGQFELRLKEGKDFTQRSNQGLDLCVYSLLTNTNRDIKTLSGGETFLAALSMALGMADIVQAMAGSIHLDMMFIDEGFGSLDEVSRQQAVQVLQELSDDKRMIGIISHVTELKEQVARKLIIEKGENGSKAHWE